MQLIDPLRRPATAAVAALEPVETAAATASSALYCPVCSGPTIPCVSMGLPARFCEQHNVAMPALPE